MGIAIAAIGILLTDIAGNTQYDAINSLIIGILLMSFAFFLAKENLVLLLGESVSQKQQKQIIDVVTAVHEVHKVVTMKTMHLRPTVMIIGIEVI